LTSKNKPESLGPFIDGWVEELMELSDTDLMLEAEERGEDPGAVAQEMRQIAREAAKKVGRSRMDEAKAALAALRQAPRAQGIANMSTEDKQRIVARFTPHDPRLRGRLTLAARGREGASEQEVDGVLEDLIALGVIDSDGNDL